MWRGEGTGDREVKVSRLYEQRVQGHEREKVMCFNKLDVETVGLYFTVTQERNKKKRRNENILLTLLYFYCDI